MKRSTWEGQTLVYRYGCPSWVDLPDAHESRRVRWPLPESVRVQLRLAHELRNELVAMEYRYRELVAGIWGLCPRVQAAQAAVVEAGARVERVVKAAKDDRVVLRHTAATVGRKDELKAARQSRRDAKSVLKLAKEAELAAVKPLFGECARARFDALAKVRADAVERGLFWATANDVLQHHDTAARRIAEAWKSGHAAQRRFRRWDGSGTLSTQVMWQQGKPRRTPDVLAALDSPWRNVFRITRPDTRDKTESDSRQRTIHVRVAKGADPVPIPIVYHRPLLADGEVTDVRLTRRCVAGQYRWSVAVTVRLAEPELAVGGVPVSVVFGWGSAGEGAVHVARVGSPFGVLPQSPPGQLELAGVIVEGGGYVDVFAPTVWRTLLSRDDSIHSHRDELVDVLRAAVVAALDEMPDRGELPASTDVARWRSPRRFAVLARVWPAGHPLAETLETWRQRDRHLWEYEAHERDQVVARRRDAYRKVAAWICGQASEILLDYPPVAELRQVPDVGDEDIYPARAGRRQVQFAAPGDLRAAVAAAARRRGVKVVDVRRSGRCMS